LATSIGFAQSALPIITICLMTISVAVIVAKSLTRFQQIPWIIIGRLTMRLLLTSDWQAEHSNIDECEIAIQQYLK
jgi:hypothetical protein